MPRYTAVRGFPEPYVHPPGWPQSERFAKGIVCHLVSSDSALELARMIPLRDEDRGAAQHPVWTIPD